MYLRVDDMWLPLNVSRVSVDCSLIMDKHGQYNRVVKTETRIHIESFCIVSTRGSWTNILLLIYFLGKEIQWDSEAPFMFIFLIVCMPVTKNV